MHIEQLKLVNFRNYEHLKLNFSKSFNIIYGENAQGKTNILEAVFLCAAGRSHRTSKDAELVKIAKNNFFIKLEYKKSSMDSSIEIFYEKEQKKKIKINDIPVKKIGSLMGNLNAVIFSPEDLAIVKEGPSERRRFIDMTICQLKPSYFYDLQQYAKVLQQRNSLLREISKNKALSETLEIWNENLVKIGARIIKVREEFIKRLNVYVEAAHKKLAGGKESLYIKYSPSISVKECTTDEIEKTFKKVLEQNVRKEIYKQSTLYGPQRDDYEIFLNNMNLKVFGSQGQQRTAVLSIKLSELEIMKEDTGEYPVLLLDDVMSELDSNRQRYLMENMNHIQTFITCTGKEIFEEINKEGYSFFNVKNGEVICI